MKKNILFVILLVALTQLALAQRSSIEEVLNQILSAKDLAAGSSGFRYDPFAVDARKEDAFDSHSFLDAIKSNPIRGHEAIENAFLEYEDAMIELSSLVSEIDLEEFLEEDINPSARLLLKIAADRNQNWEYYREIFEFYAQPKWLYRGIQKTPEERAIDSKLKESRYKYAWAYYLYAPEIAEIKIINDPHNLNGRIIQILAEIDDGEAYSFVLRELDAGIKATENTDSSVPYPEEMETAIKYYLIAHPNKASLEYVIKVSQLSSNAKSMGSSFAYFLKSKHSELRHAWETLFEEADQDSAFAEFLEGYRGSN